MNALPDVKLSRADAIYLDTIQTLTVALMCDINARVLFLMDITVGLISFLTYAA